MNKIFSAPNIIKTILLVSLLACLGFNYYSFKTHPDIFTAAKKKTFAFNQGDSYLGRLNFWYVLVQNGDWDDAKTLEPGLDQADISSYKSTHQPQEIQKSVDALKSRQNKTADDWVELSKLQSKIGQYEEARISVNEAHKIDPIRDDINKLFYALNK